MSDNESDEQNQSNSKVDEKDVNVQFKEPNEGEDADIGVGKKFDEESQEKPLNMSGSKQAKSIPDGPPDYAALEEDFKAKLAKYATPSTGYQELKSIDPKQCYSLKDSSSKKVSKLTLNFTCATKWTNVDTEERHKKEDDEEDGKKSEDEDSSKKRKNLIWYL